MVGNPRRLRARVRSLVLAIPTVGLATAVLITTGGVGLAEPKPSEKQLRRQLSALQKDLDKLVEDYNASLAKFNKARKSEKAATSRFKRAQAQYEDARRSISKQAALRYQGQIDPFTAMFTASDPGTLINQIAITQQIMAEQAVRLEQFGEVRDAYARAGSAAARLTAELRTTTTELGLKRKKAETLIEKIRDKLDRLASPKSRRANGSWVPELPAGPDNITPRMRIVRDLIRQRFTLAYGVGCYRSENDGGEHPLGRACDFMLSSGGQMPFAEQARLGDQISAWAIENAGRLGIMYIIYKQRIWHVRNGAWKAMSNRGGVTANHYDHPHISVY